MNGSARRLLLLGFGVLGGLLALFAVLSAGGFFDH
jgi:hypothetical protein